MNTGLRFKRRYSVESVFDSIALVGDGEDMWVIYNIEWIAWLLRAHAIADGEIVIRVNTCSQRDDGD
jgi:hypothetical protein